MTSPSRQQKLRQLFELLYLQDSDQDAIVKQGILTVSSLIKTNISALDQLMEREIISLGAYNEIKTLIVYCRLYRPTTDQLLAIDPDHWENLTFEELQHLLTIKESSALDRCDVEITENSDATLPLHTQTCAATDVIQENYSSPRSSPSLSVKSDAIRTNKDPPSVELAKPNSLTLPLDTLKPVEAEKIQITRKRGRSRSVRINKKEQNDTVSSDEHPEEYVETVMLQSDGKKATDSTAKEQDKNNQDASDKVISNQKSDDEKPKPTARGGYSHTQNSKAKISVANKGNIPWNLGKTRTEEERAKISASVSAWNREKLLEKLKVMGISEEEWKEQQKEKKRDRNRAAWKRKKLTPTKSNSTNELTPNDSEEKKAQKDALWLEHFEELKTFKAREGHFSVPVFYKENPRLGHWAKQQRLQYSCQQEGRESAITEDQKKLLDEIDFVVDKSHRSRKSLHDAWRIKFEELEQFRASEGHCEVPFSYSKSPELGHWVSMQRKSYRRYQQGTKTIMMEDRVKALTNIGFVWNIAQNRAQSQFKNNDELWKLRIKELKEFKACEGHTVVPKRYPENPSLGAWVNHQRSQYNRRQEGKKSFITDERIKDLEEIGFIWKG